MAIPDIRTIRPIDRYDGAMIGPRYGTPGAVTGCHTFVEPASPILPAAPAFVHSPGPVEGVARSTSIGVSYFDPSLPPVRVNQPRGDSRSAAVRRIAA